MFFTGPNCPNCRLMKPILERAVTQVQGRDTYDVETVDISTPEGETLAARYGVSGLPTLVFLDDPKATWPTDVLRGLQPLPRTVSWLRGLPEQV
nr:thioredoxin family protein [Deinococcus sp. 6YEL10]